MARRATKEDESRARAPSEPLAVRVPMALRATQMDESRQWGGPPAQCHLVWGEGGGLGGLIR